MRLTYQSSLIVQAVFTSILVWIGIGIGDGSVILLVAVWFYFTFYISMMTNYAPLAAWLRRIMEQAGIVERGN